MGVKDKLPTIGLFTSLKVWRLSSLSLSSYTRANEKAVIIILGH